jgi:uncharacterized membrane protein
MANSINGDTALLFQCTAILLSGLLAGLMYGYDCSIVKGLAKLPDEQYLHGVQIFQHNNSKPIFHAQLFR